MLALEPLSIGRPRGAICLRVSCNMMEVKPIQIIKVSENQAFPYLQLNTFLKIYLPFIECFLCANTKDLTHTASFTLTTGIIIYHFTVEETDWCTLFKFTLLDLNPRVGPEPELYTSLLYLHLLSLCPLLQECVLTFGNTVTITLRGITFILTYAIHVIFKMEP